MQQDHKSSVAPVPKGRGSKGRWILIAVPLFLLGLIAWQKRRVVEVEVIVDPNNSGVVMYQRLATEVKRHPEAKRIIVWGTSSTNPSISWPLEYNRDKQMLLFSPGGCETTEKGLYATVNRLEKDGNIRKLYDYLPCYPGIH